VALAKTEGNFAAVARRLGVSRGSLRDYLRIRPETEAAMRATLPPPLTERERKDNLRRQGREHARRYRAAHPDEARAKRAAWYRETPKGRRSGLLARERRRGVPLDAEAQEYLTILEGDPCTWCGGRDPITPDHLTPVSKGGDSRWQNLTGACLSCNASRGPKSVLAFLAYRKGVMI
jgi:5-methylcytosine-specific restriction endonuclease McrA